MAEITLYNVPISLKPEEIPIIEDPSPEESPLYPDTLRGNIHHPLLEQEVRKGAVFGHGRRIVLQPSESYVVREHDIDSIGIMARRTVQIIAKEPIPVVEISRFVKVNGQIHEVNEQDKVRLFEGQVCFIGHQENTATGSIFRPTRGITWRRGNTDTQVATTPPVRPLAALPV